MSTKIIATLGPASFGPTIIKGMASAGVDIFRINMSHTDLDDLAFMYKLATCGQKPVGIDTEGIRGRPNRKWHGFTKKDLEAFPIINELKVSVVFLSFCSYAEDVLRLREHFDHDVFVVSKIESTKGLRNLKEICAVSDEILIDRGDLSEDVPLVKIPYAQDYIVEWAWTFNTPVHVATNLMESMLTEGEPTRAEVNDIVKTLEAGASGLVLAGETAIGRFPEKAVTVLREIITEFENHGQLDRSYNTTEVIDWLVT